MATPRLVLSFALGVAVVATAAVAKDAFKGARYAAAAHVSLTTARARALTARPGKITDQELEKEPGGSGLRYSFDIAADGKTYEVGIDAKTGKVLENAAEGPHPD